MKIVEQELPHFHDLEQLTKAGLIGYLVVLTVGITVAIAGIERAYVFVLTMNTAESLLVALAGLNVFYIIVRGVNKIHWLGELHVWLDKNLFRFLVKSNDIIFREFISLVGPDIRAAFVNRSNSEQHAIAQLILSHLAEDPTILHNLLRRGIFRSWIWYWINLHGIFVFVVLTLVTFAKFMMMSNRYSQALFISIAAVTIVHFILSIVSGYTIVIVTKRIVREMIHRHRPAIISFLHNYLAGKGFLPR